MLGVGRDPGLDQVQALLENRELSAILVQHAHRGLRVQFLLRVLLAVFMALSISAEPPDRYLAVIVALVLAYLAWAVGLAWWARHGGGNPLRWVWAALLVDTAAMTALTLLAGASAQQTWTADLLVQGLFVLPVLGATQLRPRVTALTSGLALVAYFAAVVATKSANIEPWGYILIRVFVLAVVCVGSVGLTRVQLSRVAVISELVELRTALLDELTGLEQRERTALSEQLHDGALQYVLAARLDLDDLRDGTDPAALDRIEQALSESSELLRDVVTELHPAVLRQAGLARAVRDLAETTARRGNLDVDVDTAGWEDEPTDADLLLYGCARELVANVVKHAHASRLRVVVRRADRHAQLVVADNGVGLQPEDRERRLAEGHVGLASLGTRIAASGGEIAIRPGADVDGTPRGTVVCVDVPVEPAPVSPVSR